MKYLLTLLALFLTSCTSVEFISTNPTDHTTVITSVEKSLFDEQEKLSLTLSQEKGGYIKNISWQGRELLQTPVAENFPDAQNDFKKQRALLIDDNSGLLIVDIRQRKLYQFRRSYNVSYNNDTEEYIVEVIYNVTNQSSEKDFSYKWDSFIKLKEKPQHYHLAGDWTTENLKKISSQDTPGTGLLNLEINGQKNLQLQVRASEVKGLTLKLENNGQSSAFGNSKESVLQSKERVSWKVQYVFKETP